MSGAGFGRVASPMCYQSESVKIVSIESFCPRMLNLNPNYEGKHKITFHKQMNDDSKYFGPSVSRVSHTKYIILLNHRSYSVIKWISRPFSISTLRKLSLTQLIFSESSLYSYPSLQFILFLILIRTTSFQWKEWIIFRFLTNVHC